MSCGPFHRAAHKVAADFFTKEGEGERDRGKEEVGWEGWRERMRKRSKWKPECLFYYIASKVAYCHFLFTVSVQTSQPTFRDWGIAFISRKDEERRTRAP